MYQAIFLMGSNIAFLLPSVLAYRRAMVYEGTVYLLMCIVSTFYHYVDTGHQLLGYKTWQILDFYNAFMMISRTGLMVFYNTSDDESEDAFKRNTMIKQVCHVVVDNLGLLLVLENVSTAILVTILAGVVALMIVIAIVWFRDNLEHIDVWDLGFGTFLLFAGTMCYTLGGSGDQYWWVHSLWHILAALGVALMVEALNRQWSLLKWVLRMETPPPTTTILHNTGSQGGVGGRII